MGGVNGGTQICIDFFLAYNQRMLGVLYIIAATFLGDIICRRIFLFTTGFERWASAFLTGILLSSCITYLATITFAWTASPLVWGNVIFAVIGVATALAMWRWFPSKGDAIDDEYKRPPGRDIFDHAVLLISLFVGSWLFFSTLNYTDGAFSFASRSWSDFGANISLAQSMALGNNFPPDHPFFPGEPIKYHFLLWFLAADLSFLGLNIVWAVNILSILSLISMLVLLMTFAEVLFNSRVVARLSVLLFFLATSSLSYITYLWSKNGIADAVSSIYKTTQYVTSGFPYRGDDWGALSVMVYANQRQLISAVGIVLMVLIFLVRFYQRKNVMAVPRYGSDAISEDFNTSSTIFYKPENRRPKDIYAFIFCGVLIGCLPYWNTPLFVAASLIIAVMFALFPYRHYLAVLIISIIAVGLPQMLILISGPKPENGFSYFKWGYIVTDPTIGKLIDYLLWTFGLKLFLLALAFWVVPKMHRRLFLALGIPAVIVFMFQLSTDMFNNHKLLNIWLTLTSVYVAYAIWTIGRHGIANKIIAVVLTVVMVFGAFMDMFAVYNDGKIVTKYDGDELTSWLLANTKPGDIFLSDKFLSHPILMTGRKVYVGNTLYAWTAGYAIGDREKKHQTMFKTGNKLILDSLLKNERISYIAIDDGVRTNDMTKGLNEAFFDNSYELVYEDKENRYRNLKIYRVSFT